jgi:hypothetical protein
LFFSLLSVCCVSADPAGSGEYENPSYADVLKGYFYCGEDPVSAAFGSGGSTVVWISEPANNRLWYKDVSKAIVNPLNCDTLLVDFSPGQIISPPAGDLIYVSSYNSFNVYAVNTVTLKWERVFTNSSSIRTMQLSSNGSTMYLGSLGTPWHIEAVSTANWNSIASVSTDWPVLRLELSQDSRFLAAGNSGLSEILLFNAADLSPKDTLSLPMRVGTMAFTSDSKSIVVLDAASGNPLMIRINIETGNEEYRSQPFNSYLINERIPNSNTLLLPRDQDESISVLNMDNMIFAPSIKQNQRIGAVCVSQNEEYIVAVSRTTTPGRATVFIKGE